MEQIFHSLIAQSSVDLRQIRNYKDTFAAEFESQCIDLIWLFDNFHYPTGHPQRKQFVDLVQRIIDGRLLNEKLLKERLDVELLNQIKILAEPESFQKRIIRTNTALFYKQSKHNLLRESLIGYSHFFCQSVDGQPFDKIQSFVSGHALDPNCSLEILIDLACTDLNANYSLLNIFLTNYYSNYANLPSIILSKEENFENETNKSRLMKLVCLLIRDKFLRLSDILSEKLFETVKNSTAESNSLERHPSVVLLLYHLIDLNLFDIFLPLLQSIPKVFEYKMISKKICEFLFTTINETKIDTFADWFTKDSGIFSSYNDFLCKSLYFVKNCDLSQFPALIALYLRIGTWAVQRNESQKEIWLYLFNEYLMNRILSINVSFPPLFDSLSSFLFNYSYKIRFFVYNEMKNIKNASSVAVSVQTRKALRRLSTETVKVIGKNLCKLACINPLIVFNCCLDQVQAYDNLISPLIDSFKYLFPVQFDILTFVLLESLANPSKDPIKGDGINLSDWLQNLNSFSGSIAKKYPSVDLESIFYFILAQLGNENLLILNLLEELIHKMTGYESFASVTDIQLEALSGGPVLRTLHFAGNYKKSTQRFKNSLLNLGILQQLFILIAHQQSPFHYDNLKLIGNIIDKSRQVLDHLRDVFNDDELEDFTLGNKSFHFHKSSPENAASMRDLFTSLSINQIYCPTELYQSEMKKATSENNIKLCSKLETEYKLILQQTEQFNAMIANINMTASPNNLDHRCLFERCINSSTDSFFCIKFIQTLKHNQKDVFMDLINDFLNTYPLILSLTENEVCNYARVYRASLELLESNDRIIEHGNNLLFKLVSLLETDEFIVIRNCVLFLRFLLGSFPLIQEQASMIEHSFYRFRTDSRQDIKVLANSYLSLLIGARDKLKSSEGLDSSLLEPLKLALENCLREKVVSSMEVSLEIGECEEESPAVQPQPLPVEVSPGKRKYESEPAAESKRYRQDESVSENRKYRAEILDKSRSRRHGRR